MYTNTNTHTCKHTQTDTHKYASANIHMQTHIGPHKHTGIHTHAHRQTGHKYDGIIFGWLPFKLDWHGKKGE